MLFNTKLFILVFLPLALGGYCVIGKLGRRAALAWILAVSLVFYGCWKPVFCFCSWLPSR